MSSRHQPEHGKPQPGLEQARKDQQAATAIIVAERRKQMDTTKRQLDVLRKTRAQREVGTLTIPQHLRAPIGYSDRQLNNEAAERVIINPATGLPFD